MEYKLSFVIFELAWTAVFILALQHALGQWGRARTALFFIPAITFGWLLEWAFQTYFQGYRYGNGFLMYVANVPLSVALTWAALFYIGSWLVREKFRVKPEWMATPLTALLLVLIDALHFEPMAYAFGFWTWTNPGSWFGAQPDNFALWFFTPALQLTAFQAVDAQKWPAWKKMGMAMLLVPLQFIVLVLALQTYRTFAG